jgi:NTP pyrophosphatase (non-canonical NTP hydrolase)
MNAMKSQIQTDVLMHVKQERTRQDQKWGEQNHDPITWVTILTEEVGELAQAALHARFGGPKAYAFGEEATHCAAVAVAILECLVRDKWRWSELPAGGRDG